MSRRRSAYHPRTVPRDVRGVQRLLSTVEESEEPSWWHFNWQERVPGQYAGFHGVQARTREEAIAKGNRMFAGYRVDESSLKPMSGDAMMRLHSRLSANPYEENASRRSRFRLSPGSVQPADRRRRHGTFGPPPGSYWSAERVHDPEEAVARVRLLSRLGWPDLGEVVQTPGVGVEVSLSDVYRGLERHSAGDWGELGADDWRENERALEHGERLLSVYTAADGVRFWIITEADRSVTTVLLPEEY